MRKARLVFESVSLETLDTQGLTQEFENACVDLIEQLTGVTRERLRDVTLTRGSVVFEFGVLPASDAGNVSFFSLIPISKLKTEKYNLS